MENSGFERKLEAFFIVRVRLLDFLPVLEVVLYFQAVPQLERRSGLKIHYSRNIVGSNPTCLTKIYA